MNWYKLSKKKKNEDKFTFYEEIKDIWREVLNQEKDAVDISFDLENNESVSDARRYSLEARNKTWNDHNKEHNENLGTLSVYAQLWSAGGDWECPVNYFICQIYEDSKPGPKFVFVPEKRDGNVNLVKSDDKTKWVARSDEECNDREERKLWKALRKHVEKRANQYYNDKSIDDYKVSRDDEFRMYSPYSGALKLVRQKAKKR
jgi:hypothetical protein